MLQGTECARKPDAAAGSTLFLLHLASGFHNEHSPSCVPCAGSMVAPVTWGKEEQWCL